MATMKDVARRCGISESTVSHVINNTRPVAPETRAKILRVMGELNYHGNAHARRLARGHSDFVGLVISDIENPFYPGLIKAFEGAALQGGFDVLLSTTRYDADRAEAACRKLIENRAAGVAVMTSSVDPKLATLLSEAGIASVFLDAGTPGRRRSRIRLDFGTGARAAINYLHNLGHRDYALVAGPQNRPSHVAYRKAIETVVRAHRSRLLVVEAPNTVAGGEAGARDLLTGGNLPTAILCSSDLTAIGVIRTLRNAGVDVPADASVVGADDIPLATLTSPSLTTIRIPRERLGQVAFEVLHAMLKDEKTSRDETLETELAIRESSAAPRRRAKST